MSQSYDIAVIVRLKPGVLDPYLNSKTGLMLEAIEFEGFSILCDTSTSKIRPILPASWARPIFDSIHGLSHPGPKPTQQAKHSLPSTSTTSNHSSSSNQTTNGTGHT